MKILSSAIKSILKEQSDIRTLLLDVLATLRAAYMVYRNAHWQVSGNDYYGNHLLLQRIYGEAEKHIDDWAEQMVGYYGPDSVELSDSQISIIRETIIDANKEKEPMERSLHVAKELKNKLENVYKAMKGSGSMSLGWDDTIMTIAQAKDKHIFLLQQAIGKKKEIEKIEEYAKIKLSEIAYVTKGVSQDFIDDLADRGINIYDFGSKLGNWDPKHHGLTALQIETIAAFLKRKLNHEKSLSPEESASNFSVEDIAVANMMGDKTNPEYIRRAKIFNISHLIDDLQSLVMHEHWDKRLDKVIDKDDFPWNNEEEPEINDNPLNPYDANNKLSKVKAWAHPKTYSSQRAGVKKGSGSPGGQRFPGGTRQGTSSGY